MPRKKAETASAASKAAKKAESEPAAAVKRTLGRRSVVKVNVVLEYQGRQFTQDDVVSAIKDSWTGETIKTLDIYVKPEDGAAYYVVNGASEGKIEL